MNIQPFKTFIHVRSGTDFFWALCRGITNNSVEVCIGYDLVGQPILQSYPKDLVKESIPRKAWES